MNLSIVKLHMQSMNKKTLTGPICIPKTPKWLV